MLVLRKLTHVTSAVLINKSLSSAAILKNYTIYKNVGSSSFHSISRGMLGARNASLANVTILGRVSPNTKSVGPVLKRCQHGNSLDIDTNVRNNVLLYKYDNKGIFRMIKLIAVGAVLSWIIYVYCTLALGPLPPNNGKTFFEKLEYYLYLLCLVTGPLICSVCWVISARTVKYIILNKGGKKVTLVTYHMLKRNRSMVIPVEHISAKISRAEQKSSIPLKVKGKSFFYLVDTSGEFLNGLLYDNTVGLKRV